MHNDKVFSSGVLNRIKVIQESFQKIKQWGYADLNYDAQFKWANIIHEFHQYFGEKPSNLKILDIGGGLGPLDMYFSNFGTCLNIDLSFDKTWFPTNNEKLLPGSSVPYDKKNLSRIQGDAIKILNRIDYKFDFIYDSCSLIHFGRINKNKNNKLTSEFLPQIFKLLARVSHDQTLIISSTDIAHSRKFEINDFLYQTRILNAAIEAGLNYQIVVGENDYSIKSLKPIKRNITLEDTLILDGNKKSNIQNYLSMYYPENLKIRTKIIVMVVKFSKNNGHIIEKLRLPLQKKVASGFARTACRIESRYFS